MMWLGLLIGAVFGALLGELPGAIVCGFIGWMVGAIIQSNQQRGKAAAKVALPGETLEARVARLEKTVAKLEAQLRFEPEMGSRGIAAEAAPGTTAEAAPVPAPVIPDAAPAATVPDPIPEPPPSPVLHPPSPPEPPSPPSPFVAWLTGGNAIVKVGLLILFFGLAFLVKYAADHALLPVELRVAAVAAGGIALLFFGWRLREKRPAYALALQGGGVAVLYLTTFAAFRLWHLLPGEVAFVMLALIAVFAAFLAIRQDSMTLAVIGAAGGFAAPVLASTGGGSHVALFSYYLLLNLGIAGVALFKAWRPLNLTGFLFTFFIGLAWGMKYYAPQHFESTEPFLVAFFVLYVVVAILFARNQAPALKRFVDGTLVFGTPLAAFALQAGMLKDTEFGLAWSSIAASAFYLLLATWLLRSGRESWKLLAKAFFALGVVFATVAIPLALDARWTSALWAVEGAAIVWVGLRQDQRLARLFGLLLQVLAGLAYFDKYRVVPEGLPLLDAAFIGAVLLAVAGLWTHRQLLNARDTVSPFESQLVPAAFVWGIAWWIFAGRHEIEVRLPRDYELSALVAFFGATALALGALSQRWNWRHAAIATRWLLPLLTLCALAAVADIALRGHRHPASGLGWIAWPFAIAVHFRALRKLGPAEPSKLSTALHAGGVWLIALVGALELHWVARTFTARHTAWSAAAIAIVPALLMHLMSRPWADPRWPVAAHPRAYRAIGPLVLACALGIWSVAVNLSHTGASTPLPYVPLLNAIDLAHVLAAIAVATAVIALRRTPGVTSVLASRGTAIVVGAIAFIWVNAMLLRTLHHWAGISYTMHAMSRSVLAQASISVFWSILALGLMVFATRRAMRPLWIAGAVLMGVVVLKLFAVDLSNVGGIERIVSFIAVGVLMLVIGYFSPVPPRRKEETA